ncbi:MAG: hypothetical protein JWQ36_1622 [Enterovirga sp.]|jgi:hypothetical protein|nr:hypothetical protein [Enterovirga sp.]
MANHQDAPTGSAFRVCLNGFTVRDCASESDAIGSAIELKKAVAGAKVTVINVRAGLTVEVCSAFLGDGVPARRR